MIYIFSDVSQGGTLRYFRDLASFFPCIRIKTALELKAVSFSEKDILLYQKITDPDADTVVLNVLDSNPNLRLLIVVHDYFFLCDTQTGSLYHTPSFSSMPETKKTVFRRAKAVVFPSHYLKEYYSRFFLLPSYRVEPHIDNVCFRPLRVPPLPSDKKIKLGIITPLNLFKGKYHYIYMFKHVHVIAGFRLEYHLFGTSFPYLPSVVKSHPPYQEDDIYEQIRGIHGILFLNHFPEMYSYALTKGINSGLPLLYSDMGAIKERLEGLDDQRYFPTDPSDKPRFLRDVEAFVSYISGFEGSGGDIQTSFPMHIPDFYKTLDV